MTQPAHARRHRFAFLVITLALALTGLPPADARADEPAPHDHARKLSQAFRQAAAASVPAVVTLRATSDPQPEGDASADEWSPDEFRRFLQSPRRRATSVGSGVIIDPSGILLTNNHVVADADRVLIQLADGREFVSTKISTDELTDLAVVRFEGDGELVAARLGDSDRMEIGDWVIAVGAPFELKSTVSAGIISGKARELDGAGRSRFLQTDAAINPGNSGGPLVNLDGEVVGINTAIASRSGGYQGIGFAIPINSARCVTEQLIAAGEVRRAYLGIQIADMTADIADLLDAENPSGVLVMQVYPETGAAKAGMEAGDIIVSFDGTRVRGTRDLQEVVERAAPADDHDVQVVRSGAPVTMSVALTVGQPAAAAANGWIGAGENGSNQTYSDDQFGLTVADLTADQIERTSPDGTAESAGVLVTRVDQAGVAATQGLRAGMVIFRVGKQPVSNVEQFRSALDGHTAEDGVLVFVRIGPGTRPIVLKAAD
ncbi:MAG: Do family serine endopeptidase [Planctomycetales bacterium]|nr:Do family serine endopeptidase [Planctomycetales bacterium]